jgi:two-component system, cell cycle sensor histidine kinase and response regulator CckA
MSATQILVVEDERLVATALQNELGQFGYGVSGIASSATEAVEKALAGKPDLILMDIGLKGTGDGIDAAQKIHDRCGIPVVYLSAYSDPATVARASETGAFGYLLKPYEEQELRTTIEIALAKHRAEQQLEETRRWLAAIHNAIDDAVIATDAQQNIRFINSAAQTLTGWRKEDVVGLPLRAVCRLVETSGPIVLDEMAARVVRTGRTLELPAAIQVVSQDNRETPVEGALSAIRDSRGELLGIVLAFRNISVRLELELLRRQDEERARRLQKLDAISRLAGGLSQHLNNLLTVILGDTSLALTATSESTESWASLKQVEVAAQRAAQIVQRMMLFSTLSGRPANQFHPADPNQLITKCLKSVGAHLDDRVSLKFTPADGIWKIAADEQLLGQSLLELALNSQDAMPEGGRLNLELQNVQISPPDLSNHPRRYLGDFVRLRVSDTGPGMPQAIRAHLFEPGFTTKEVGTAAGLGLALVHAVVEQHHGWIECQSQADSGMQFDLYFPRYGAELAATSNSGVQQQPVDDTPTLLLADADPMVRDVGRRILEAEGYRVLLAEDGLQAVAIYQQAQQRIDLAILDLNLPRLSAYAVLERLVEMNPIAQALFSGGYHTEDLTEGQGHTLGVITKPYRPTDLVEMVRRALSHASMVRS